MGFHGRGMNLLHDLSVHSNQEMTILSDGVRLTESSDHFRLLMISQSTNAAWNISRMIRFGYVRFALAMGRFLREGHVAVLWATAFPEIAGECWDKMAEGGMLAGDSWPRVGTMAQEVSDQLDAEGTPKGRRWSPFIKAVRDTQDLLFTHAVSDWALQTSFRYQPGVITPFVGPTYDRDLTKLAINQMVPLFSILLHDSANVSAAIRDTDVSNAARSLGTRADSWWQSHPIPLYDAPKYPASGESENLASQ